MFGTRIYCNSRARRHAGFTGSYVIGPRRLILQQYRYLRRHMGATEARDRLTSILYVGGFTTWHRGEP